MTSQSIGPFPSARYDFAGYAAVVTGAARGVGRALAHGFVEAGANVVAVDRDSDGLTETCEELGVAAVSVLCDISTPEGVKAVMESAKAHWGRLDICVNNAAVAPHTALLNERVEVWDQVFAVNTRGTFLMTQAAARVMIELKRPGRIINFSSGVVGRGSPGAAAYASSRAATESFTRTAAIELAPYGILVNTVRPGLIDTQPKPLPPSMKEALEDRIPQLPLSRAGEPEEVVAAVLFLASSGASYMTGTTLTVDGGSMVGGRASGTVVDEDVRYDWVTGKVRT